MAINQTMKKAAAYARPSVTRAIAAINRPKPRATHSFRLKLMTDLLRKLGFLFLRAKANGCRAYTVIGSRGRRAISRIERKAAKTYVTLFIGRYTCYGSSYTMQQSP